MVMLVSLKQASDHLKRDTTDDDADLTLLIHAASIAVIQYLKTGATFLDSSGEPPQDSSGDPIDVPQNVQLAVLYLIGVYFDQAAGTEMEKWKQGYLPFPVINLLYMMRDPACQ